MPSISIWDFLFSFVVLVGLSLPIFRLCLVFLTLLHIFVHIFLFFLPLPQNLSFSSYAFGVVLLLPPVDFGGVSGHCSLLPFPFALALRILDSLMLSLSFVGSAFSIWLS